MRYGEWAFGICVVAVGIGLLAGCSDDMSSLPVAPSPEVALNPPSTSDLSMSRSTAVAEDVLGLASSEGVGLKTGSPKPQEPIDVELSEATPLLVAMNATGEYVNPQFEYQFSIRKTESGPVVEEGNGRSQSADSTSYRVQKRLDLGAVYLWRVRASLEEEFGPWSEYVSFRTAPIIFGAPLQLVSPVDGNVVGNRPVFIVRSGAVEGVAERIVVQIRLAPEGRALADTDIVGNAEVESEAGQERRISLGDDYRGVVPGTKYTWQARTVAYIASSPRYSPWSEQASFETAVHRLGAPRPISPIERAEVSTQPAFVVRNATVEGDVGSRVIEVEVALDGGFSAAIIRGKADMGDGRETRIRLRETLRPGMSYFWRTRAVAADAPYGRVVSPWSMTATFMTRAERVGGALGPVKNPPPNLGYVIERVAREHPAALRAARSTRSGRVPTGANDPGYQFLFLTIRALREEDGGRWGATYWRNPGHPDNLTKSRVGYYLGNGNPQGSSNMATIDFYVNEQGRAVWYNATASIKRDYPRARGEWRNPPE